MTKHKNSPKNDRTFSEKVDDALRLAIAQVVAEHQASGEPLVVAKDGKVVWLKPEGLQHGETECLMTKTEDFGC